MILKMKFMKKCKWELTINEKMNIWFIKSRDANPQIEKDRTIIKFTTLPAASIMYLSVYRPMVSRIKNKTDERGHQFLLNKTKKRNIAVLKKSDFSRN